MALDFQFNSLYFFLVRFLSVSFSVFSAGPSDDSVAISVDELKRKKRKKRMVEVAAGAICDSLVNFFSIYFRLDSIAVLVQAGPSYSTILCLVVVSVQI